MSGASARCLVCVEASSTHPPEKWRLSWKLFKNVLISKIKNCDFVLELIVPKILGIVNARCQKLHGFGDCCAQINGVTVLSAVCIDAHRLMMSVYDQPASEILKVFSVHVTDCPGAMDPNF